jgi:Zn-dependent protease
MQMLWFILLLIVSGWLTYVVIARQVKDLTRTPVWLLWLVFMFPILCLILWALLTGGRMIPPLVLAVLFVGCFGTYVHLIQRGRISPSRQPQSPTQASPAAHPTPAPPPRAVTPEEEERLKTCFPWPVFYLHGLECRPQAVICSGKLRADPQVAYETVRSKVQQEFGDRFLVLLQEGQNRQPVFALVNNPYITPDGQQIQMALDRPSWGIGLALLSFVTTTWAGYEMVKLLPGHLQPSSPSWMDGLPYALAWMGFFVVRELGYYVTAKRYRIPVTLPYFIPLPPLPQIPIGTLGAFIQLRSPVPHRKALFDIRAVGSLMGLVLAIGLLAWGLTQSTTVPVPQHPNIFDFDGLKPQYSLLLTLFSKWALGQQLTVNTAVALHPIAFAGWLGVLFSAFNLMPLGGLDGGRIVHAVYGQQVGAMIGNISRWLLLLLALTQNHLLIWALLLFLLPTMDEPTLNDVSELNGVRDGIGLCALGLMLMIIFPVPPALQTWLGLM